MATYTASTFDFDTSTDANFRALWGTVDTQIQGLGGWSYVSQTGDIDPSTATAPGSGSYAGFRVYSTTVGSTTWYVRLDFGRVANGPSIKHKFGTSVNGSGTLGGQTSTQVTTNYGASVVGTNKPVYIAQATGRLMLWLGSGTNNGTWWGVSFHGNVDNTGSMVSGMEHFTYGDSGFACSSQYVPASGTVPAKKAYWPCAFGTEASQVIGSTAMTGHPVLWDENGANNPTLAAGEFPSTDFSSGFSTSVTIYGASHTFLVGQSFGISPGSSNVSAGLRYE